MTSEFELIRKYFSRPAPSALLGVGDDCALLQPRPGMLLAVSTDMMVAARHFFLGSDPRKLGHKALAVNLSDLAAMGADPRWAVLSLAMPEADEAFLSEFAEGFYGIASSYGVDLIGGDTTRGPLAISVTILGEVPPGLALRRDAAQPGDDIWLTGATGEAALAVAHLSGRISLAGSQREACLARLHTPQPRVEAGGRLRGLAHAAIDVSDGLLADLTHILEASGVGAQLVYDSLPLAESIARCRDEEIARECLLAGGDDYELLITAPPAVRAEIDATGADLALAITRIGAIVPGAPIATLLDGAGRAVPFDKKGYDHFA